MKIVFYYFLCLSGPYDLVEKNLFLKKNFLRRVKGPDGHKIKLNQIEDFKVSSRGEIVPVQEGIKLVCKNKEKKNLEFSGYAHF